MSLRLVAFVLASSGAVACASVPVDLAALPPAPPACPVEGCAAHPFAPAPVCPGAGSSPCGGAQAAVCTERALSMWSEARGDRILSCVAAMFSDACSLDDPRACGFAGRLWLDGRGVRQDVPRAMALLAKACDGGVAMACAVAASALSDTESSDLKGLEGMRQRIDLEQSCWEGQSDSCTRAGNAYETGRDPFPLDPLRAAKLYERGCDLGDPDACNNLGDNFAYGTGVARDLGRAAELFGASCRMGDALGCANFGYMIEHGLGIAADASRARALYRDGCTMGEVYACLHVEMMAAQDAGAAPRDPMRAFEFWRDRCPLGAAGGHAGKAKGAGPASAREATACAFLGIVYEDGPDGFSRDETKSLRAMARACELGNERACEWPQLHGASGDPDDDDGSN